jgi:septal ring factor EnvC (AmiA/AmiB activator)
MTLTTLTLTLALTAPAALANDHLTQIRDHAGKLGQEFQTIRQAVKAKNYDTADVQSRVAAAEANINKLKELVAEFEAANPSVASAENKDWKKTKDLVHLIGIFHEQKAGILNSDPKNRALLRAHADALAKRAFLLQETSSNLLSNMSSGL